MLITQKLNVKKILVSPAGSSIGDQINITSVLELLSINNPHTQITYPEPYELFEVDYSKYDIVFWADVTNFVQMPSGKNIVKFDLMKTVRLIATKFNIYPKLNLPDSNPVLIPQDSVAVYFRNSDKAPGKNVVNAQALSILEYISQLGYTPILIGNDRASDVGRNYRVIDYRYKLTLSEILDVISRTKFFIGSDGGITHLAGTVKTNMVCFNFTDEKWFPVTRNRCVCFLRDEFSMSKIKTTINLLTD